MAIEIRSYDLFYDIDFKNLLFYGKVVIDLDSDKDVVLDCVDLIITKIGLNKKPVKFIMDNAHLIIETGHFSGRLEIEFKGSIKDELVGLYRAPYAKTFMISTQFEAANARRAFPCLDRPDFKAEFGLSLRIDKDLDAISNMPVESVTADGLKKVVTFKRTPKMSTYLLYIGVGRFEEISEKLGDLDIIVATVPGKIKHGEFAIKVAMEAMKFYSTYFGIPFPLPKIHMISVPEFAAGAMENWGAVTFRETRLLISSDSAIKTKKRVAQVIAHELAHMWFGDLVTLKWWNDLWLNESFAEYMSYKAEDSSFPEWDVWEDFLRDEVSIAMARDSLERTHPIEVEVKSPDEIEELFDDISYNKGGSVLRMIEDYIGSELFRKGVHEYLESHAYSNATGDDLWGSLEKISGKPVRRVMEGWILKEGFPVLTVKKGKDGLVFGQERFLLSGRSEACVWPIPIKLSLNGKSSSFLMEEEEVVVKTNVHKLKSLKVNAGRTGFYKVLYQDLYDLVWSGELSSQDKWGIISDAVDFLLSGRMSLDGYLMVLERYYEDEDLLSAQEVSGQLLLLYHLLPARIRNISRRFHLSQLSKLAEKTDENSSMFRGTVAERLAMIDAAYCRELGSMFLNFNKVEPDMKEAVAIAYARAEGNFDLVLSKYKASTTDEEKNWMLGAMMNFKDPALVERSFELVTSSQVKRQDVIIMIAAAALNPDARGATWAWLKRNMELLRGYYKGTGTLSRLLIAAIPLIGIGRYRDVERYFEENPVPEAENGIKGGLEKLRIYERLIERESANR